MPILILLILAFACHAGPKGVASCDAALRAPAPAPAAASPEVDRLYERFVAAAVGAAREDEIPRADAALAAGIRREYVRLFSRELVFADVATNLLKTGEAHAPRLRQAVEAYELTLRATPPDPDARLHRIYDAYRDAIRRSKALGRIDDPSEAQFVADIDLLYTNVNGDRPVKSFYIAYGRYSRDLMAACRAFAQRPTEPTRGCFAGHSRVATPSGPREIASLEVGDEVLSYEFETQSVTVSRVAEVRHLPARPYWVLHHPTKPIGTTGEQRFYTGVRRFEAIASFDDSQRVYGLTSDDLRPGAVAKLISRPRGKFTPSERVTATTEISLGAGAHNYFVEDVLVHDVNSGN